MQKRGPADQQPPHRQGQGQGQQASQDRVEHILLYDTTACPTDREAEVEN